MEKQQTKTDIFQRILFFFFYFFKRNINRTLYCFWKIPCFLMSRLLIAMNHLSLTWGSNCWIFPSSTASTLSSSPSQLSSSLQTLRSLFFHPNHHQKAQSINTKLVQFLLTSKPLAFAIKNHSRLGTIDALYLVGVNILHDGCNNLLTASIHLII